MLQVFFVLMLIGIMLIVLNIKAIKKEQNNFQNTLNSASMDMTDYDIEIGKIRREFSETIIELQKEIEILKNNKLDKTEKVMDEELNFIAKPNILENYDKGYKNSEVKDDIVNDINFSHSITDEIANEHIEQNDVKAIKINEIKKMVNDGISVENIAEKLQIGKGEVILVKELYMK